MRSPPHPTVSIKLPRQLAIALDRPVLNGMTPSDRNTAIRRLARLLLEAAGAHPEEISDDER
jgi:metal-responsive CopG/Arc/MetJ family transcriptional regulator